MIYLYHLLRRSNCSTHIFVCVFLSKSVNSPDMTIPPSDFQIFKYPTSDESPAINLKHDSTWTYCGPLLDPTSLPPNLYHWMSAAMEGSIVEQLISFLSHAHNFLAQTNMSNYWITIRASKPTHDFDIPRWHTDRPFFDSESDGLVTWKLCTTLVGPGTLFLARGSKARAIRSQTRRSIRKSEAASHQCSVVRCLGCAGMQEVVREKLAEKLAAFEVVQPNQGQFAFFRVGDDQGAVHSEPPIPCDRVFINVVPGEEKDLRNLMSRWGMEYPR